MKFLFPVQFTSSISNNIYANMMQQRFKQTVLSAKNGGTSEAMRRVLAQLPVCAQSFTSSPYLDLDLFSYDEKWISAMERPKPCGEHPVQFHERDTGAVRFRMHVGQPGKLQERRKIICQCRCMNDTLSFCRLSLPVCPICPASGRVHLPPDGPIRHQRAENQHRLRGQLPHQEH